jgi:hypothetical protein
MARREEVFSYWVHLVVPRKPHRTAAHVSGRFPYFLRRYDSGKESSKTWRLGGFALSSLVQIWNC